MNTSEVPRPTTAAIFPPPTKLPEPHDQRPVHNQQHTTVYVAKDLGTTPLTPMPQNGPEKIVIPISSLYPGGAGSVTTPSASMRERVHQETKGGFAKQSNIHSLSFPIMSHAYR